jgi:hypothetical protein
MDGAPQPDATTRTETDDDSRPTWWVMGIIALVAGGGAIAISLPDVWETQIADSRGTGRGKFVMVALHALGYQTTVIILAAIAIICLAIGAISFSRWLRDRKAE